MFFFRWREVELGCMMHILHRGDVMWLQSGS